MKVFDTLLKNTNILDYVTPYSDSGVKIKTSDGFTTYLSSKDLVYTFDSETYSLVKRSPKTLTEDSWVFYPKLNLNSLDNTSRIDLSKYSDLMSNVDTIFTFNTELLGIAKVLNITPHALKQLLLFESADYDKHLDKLKAYLSFTYNITETDDEKSFSNLKKYAVKNFVFFNKRFIDIDHKFLKFLAYSLFFGNLSENKLSFNKYEITPVLSSFIKSFMKTISKTPPKEDANTLVFENEVVFNYLKKLNTSEDLLLKTISYLDENSLHLFLSIIEEIIPSRKDINITIANQLKYLFYFVNKAVSYKDYKISILKDELELLDSNFIQLDDGYCLRVVEVIDQDQRLEGKIVVC